MQIEVMLVVMVVKAHGKEKMTPDTTPLNISKKKGVMNGTLLFICFWWAIKTNSKSLYCLGEASLGHS